MADSEETKAAVEYWDRVAASAKRGTTSQTVDSKPDNAETLERNTDDRAEEREERNSAAKRSRRR
jgi:hypothetical protein